MKIAHRMVGTFVALALASLFASAGLAPRAGAQAGEDAAQLRDLAERLLAPSPGYPGFDEAPRAELLLGRLPADFAFEVPVPPGGRVVGSLTRTYSGQTANVQVVLDAPGGPLAVVDFYERELAARGWGPGPSSGYSGWGSFKPPEAARSNFLCHSDTESYASISVLQRDRDTSDARISISTPVLVPSMRAYGGPCSPSSQGYGYGSDSSSLSRHLPRLQVPEGVQLQATSGMPVMPGQDYAASEVAATSEMTVGELEAQFARQLEAHGWLRVAGAAQGPLAWSSWQIPEEDSLAGYLVVLELPGENRRRLTVAEAMPTSPSIMYYTPF